MTPEAWKKIKEIVADAADLGSDERQEFLNRTCPPEFRGQVDALLSSDNTHARMLDGDVISSFAEASSERIGERVGAYEILGELGIGGMGAVYRARRADGAFDQVVALKLIKRGMDSDAILRRFINERQILASLDHRHIAHLIDGGTTDYGLPYFVMEYVEGESIIDYAQRHNLSLNRRLDLFREVCSAVAFAHQNLVIHRDLKPSNILITEDGRVKLLDFGIAKLLKTENESNTASQNFAFTPEYASPEQVRGDSLTTATDVYSLGVILYELLSGRRPYTTSGRSIGEILKAVCETDPMPPSRAMAAWRTDEKSVDKAQTKEGSSVTNSQQAIRDPELKGDLDTIILKALRKEPERRYTSVEQFAEDIRRHQAGLPVTAVRDTWGYRTSKFVRRNRVAAAAAGLILLTLLGGLGATLYQAGIARLEKAKAQQNFNDVRQLANSFLFEFHDAIENLSGSTAARELVVKRAVEYLDKLSTSSDVNSNPELWRELATAYERIGKIQGNPYHSNLGDIKGAAASYQKSLEIRQRLNKAEPANLTIQHELAAAHEGVGDISRTSNDLPGSLRNYDAALGLRLPLVEAEPQNRDFLAALSELYMRRGDIKGNQSYANLGNTSGALDEYMLGVAVAERYVALSPNDDSQALLASRLKSLALMQNDMGNSAEALATGRRAAGIFESIASRDPNNARIRTQWMSCLSVVSYALLDQDLIEDAEQMTRFIITESEKAAAADPRNVDARFNLAVSYNDLAAILRQDEKTRDAITYYQRALETTEKLNADFPSSETSSEVATTLSLLAESQLEVGDNAAALVSLERCSAEYERQLATAPENARLKDDLAETYTFMGKTLAALGQAERAGIFFDKAVTLAAEVAREMPENAKVQTRLARTYFVSGKYWKSEAQASKDVTARSKSCDLLQKSYGVLDALRQSESMSEVNAGRIDEVGKELSGCGRS